MKGRVADWAYAAGWRVIRAMPRSWAWLIFRSGADWAARKRGPGVQRYERNLRRVVGPTVSPVDIDVLVRDGLRSYARYWLDAFRLPSYSKQKVMGEFAIAEGYLIGEAVAAGTGCVIALPHAGNWDWAGAWVCGNGWPLTTVAERLQPESLYQRFLAFRESLGMEILPVTGGERPNIDILADRLAQGTVVPLLADRDLSRRGVEVTFFGGRTRMPAGPALLAIRTGAPLLVVSLWYEQAGPRGRVVGPIPLPDPESGPLDMRVRALTQTIADHLADGIAEHPSDWHMLQKLWLDDLSPGTGGRRGVADTGRADSGPGGSGNSRGEDSAAGDSIGGDSIGGDRPPDETPVSPAVAMPSDLAPRRAPDHLPAEPR